MSLDETSNPPLSPQDIDELDAVLKPQSKYTPLENFEYSLQLLATIDDNIKSGVVRLHKWQIEMSKFLCAGGLYTKAVPLQFVLAALNGSGKDAYVIAPFAVWHCITKVRSRCIITSADFGQMKSQTESYIRNMCERINEYFQDKVFTIKWGHIACKWTGSEIKMFVTDEGGRAEGYHPYPDHPNGELALIFNEGKTVKDIIYEHARKCTYNRWIIVSSPGKTSGYMYNRYVNARKYPDPFIVSEWYSRRISYQDCPHIPIERIEAERKELGEDSTWFRSTRLAEFTSLDDAVVITNEAVQKCLKLATGKEIDIGHPLHAGLDLAAGGDENALYVFKQGIYHGSKKFRASDTSITVNLVIQFLLDFGFTPETAGDIHADHGGMGESYAGHFREKGWELSWVMNQSSATRKRMFANKGAEMWYSFKRIVERCFVVLPSDDSKLLGQLASRYYGQHATSGKIVLESKQVARSKGHTSPDRADAVVLAFCGIDHSDFGDEEVDEKIASSVVTTKRLVELMEKKKWSVFEKQLQAMRTTKPRPGVRAAYRATIDV